jgi:exodeoxyribonuclease-3
MVYWKICTFNINSIRARKDLILKWLENRDNDIDVLCFQEIRVVDRDFPSKEFEKLGYNCEVYGQKGFNGVAICSKIPIKKTKKGFNDSSLDKQKRMLAVSIHDVEIVNIYAPHGDIRGREKFYYKLDWYKNFIQFLMENYSFNEKILVVGDFNVARNDLDVFNNISTLNGIGTMYEEREVFNDILNLGFIDVFRHIYPEKKQFTWWDYVGGAIWRNEGMRIDYVLSTKSLNEKTEEIEIDIWPRRRRNPKPSDHAPVILTLKL